MRAWIAAAALTLAASVGVMTLAAPIAGCGSTAPVDAGDGDGGPGDGGFVESGLGDDAAQDGGGTDGGADAKADAKIDAGPGFCVSLSPAPKFCDDFDDGDLEDDWAFKNVVGTSTIALDDTGPKSPPFAAAVVTKALTVGQSGPAHLRQTLIAAARHPSLSFSAYFTTSTTLTKGALAIATLDVSLNHFFTLYLRDDPQDGISTPTANLEEIDGATTTRHVLASPPPTGVWTRIVIDLDLDAGKANVSFDGVKALANEPISGSGGTEATFRVGAVYLFGPADPFQARFDDVVVDF